LVFNIQHYSLADGPGIRTTVFLKGCPLSCWWCHNPESQSTRPEVITVEGRCIQCGECRTACPEDALDELSTGTERCIRCGACVAACPTGARQMVGREMTITQVMAEVLKDRIFYEEGKGGMTVSGGEPLTQPEFVVALLRAARTQGIHSALDTCGFARREALLVAASLADVVLYDLKMLDDARHRRFTGVSNVEILENLRALSERHANIWLRIPIVPGITDGPADVRALGELAAALRGVRQVCLLTYHKTGVPKYGRLDRTCRLADVDPPSPQEMERLAAELKVMGLDVKIGG
jgi:pyruvate formate lyase activating enzyme